MHLLDAQTISWASQGGIAPRELINCQIITSDCLEKPEGKGGTNETTMETTKETTTDAKATTKEQDTMTSSSKDVQEQEPQTQEIGVVSCAISKQLLDAQTISWASSGGIVPQEHNSHHKLTPDSPYEQPRGGLAKEQEQRSHNINKEDPPKEQLAKEQDTGTDQI